MLYNLLQPGNGRLLCTIEAYSGFDLIDALGLIRLYKEEKMCVM